MKPKSMLPITQRCKGNSISVGAGLKPAPTMDCEIAIGDKMAKSVSLYVGSTKKGNLLEIIGVDYDVAASIMDAIL
ncbi:MAG: hypothetical protein U9R02_02805 [Thermodesulfobacteriota bacterium]|nr:hypothetical protein [Thermodesulfobacteriota bacterium]